MVKGGRLHRSLLRDQVIHEIGERASIPPFLLSSWIDCKDWAPRCPSVQVIWWVSRLQIQTLVHWKGKHSQATRGAASTPLLCKGKVRMSASGWFNPSSFAVCDLKYLLKRRWLMIPRDHDFMIFQIYFHDIFHGFDGHYVIVPGDLYEFTTVFQHVCCSSFKPLRRKTARFIGVELPFVACQKGSSLEVTLLKKCIEFKLSNKNLQVQKNRSLVRYICIYIHIVGVLFYKWCGKKQKSPQSFKTFWPLIFLKEFQLFGPNPRLDLWRILQVQSSVQLVELVWKLVKNWVGRTF